jgi:hypothetical protein
MTPSNLSPELIRDEISRIEARIEELTDAIARCGKLILFSKLVICAGVLLLLATMVGLLAFDPMSLVGAIAAVIGGIVFFGSNTSTRDQFTAELNAAEARRAELIGLLDLQLVPDSPTRH